MCRGRPREVETFMFILLIDVYISDCDRLICLFGHLIARFVIWVYIAFFNLSKCSIYFKAWNFIKGRIDWLSFWEIHPTPLPFLFFTANLHIMQKYSHIIFILSLLYPECSVFSALYLRICLLQLKVPYISYVLEAK